MVEGLVCVLLIATIFYCISVNGKLERLRREQKGMQGFIRDLSLATENADKAIQGLKKTVSSTGQELAGQIEKGRHVSRLLKSEIESAEQSINRLVVIAGGLSAQYRGQAGLEEVEAEMMAQARSVESLRRRMIGFDETDVDPNSLTDADFMAQVVGARGAR
jgi:hypothetical protein